MNLTVPLLHLLLLLSLYVFIGQAVYLAKKDAAGVERKRERQVEPRLIILAGDETQVGTKFRLAGTTSIGRASDNDIILNDSFISERHAQIVNQDGLFYLSDLNTTNGTFVAGERVVEEVVLKPGDRLRLGETVLQFNE